MLDRPPTSRRPSVAARKRRSPSGESRYCTGYQHSVVSEIQPAPWYVAMPVAAFVGTAQHVGETKYVFDPVEEFKTSGGVKGISAKLKMMSEDAVFIRKAVGVNDPNADAKDSADAKGKKGDKTPPADDPEKKRAEEDLLLEGM